ncbi:hypothetical protein ACFOWT_08270 [Croceibacterium xixiisoli]|nr:hypothetical protein [Croceibacterium xixiisoli]
MIRSHLARIGLLPSTDNEPSARLTIAMIAMAVALALIFLVPLIE